MCGLLLSEATEIGDGDLVQRTGSFRDRKGGLDRRRKHDRKDAEELARLYRTGELVTIRVPTEREERVRDLIRCREGFQREALKSRHYILKFLARRGLVYREGQNWTGKHFAWLRAI